MLILVVMAESMCGSAAFAIIDQGFRETPQGFVFALVMGLVFAVTLSMVLLRAAAAELSPPSENRSTPIRRALMWHQSLMIGCLAYGVLSDLFDREATIAALYYGAIFWTAVGTLMVGESSFLTPRVRRDLPGSFLTRSLLVWMTPGPATGLVFAILSFTVFAMSLDVIAEIGPLDDPFTGAFDDPTPHFWALAGYMMLLMATTRGCMFLIRIRNHTRPVFALAVFIIIAGMFALVPYFIALHLNDYRSVQWSLGQLTNWLWTMGLMLDGRLNPIVPVLVFLIGTAAFAIALVTTGRPVLPLRVATPQRVLEEQQREHAGADEGMVEADPLAS